MFWNRKHSDDEDEPLVPHGLIWHGTDPVADKEENPVKASNQNAEIIEIPTAKIAQSAEEKLEPIASKSISPVPKIARDEPTAAAEALPGSAPAVAPPDQPTAPHDWKLGPHIHVAEVIEITPVTSRNWLRVAGESLQGGIVRLRSFAVRATENGIRLRGQSVASRLRTKRVRIVLAGLPLRMKFFFARHASAWKIVSATSGDARLRSSMALAAISATVALIIVSVVPHYAERSLPSRMFASTSEVSANAALPAAAAVPKATPISRPAASNVLARKTALSLAALKNSVQPTKARRKVYRASEDDYIAPDTYVYYGNKSSVSR